MASFEEQIKKPIHNHPTEGHHTHALKEVQDHQKEVARGQAATNARDTSHPKDTNKPQGPGSEMPPMTDPFKKAEGAKDHSGFPGQQLQDNTKATSGSTTPSDKTGNAGKAGGDAQPANPTPTTPDVTKPGQDGPKQGDGKTTSQTPEQAGQQPPHQESPGKQGDKTPPAKPPGDANPPHVDQPNKPADKQPPNADGADKNNPHVKPEVSPRGQDASTKPNDDGKQGPKPADSPANPGVPSSSQDGKGSGDGGSASGKGRGGGSGDAPAKPEAPQQQNPGVPPIPVAPGSNRGS